MNKETKNESTSTDSDCSKTVYKTRERTLPKCKRCAAHGVMNVPLKGHKRWCEFRDCDCIKCYYLTQDQKSSAKNIAMKRAFDNDREKRQALEKYQQKKLPAGEKPPVPWYLTNVKKYSGLTTFSGLTNYTLQAIQKSGYTVLNDPSKMWYILLSLNQCAYDLTLGMENRAAMAHIGTISQAIIRQLKIIRRNIVQNITFSFIIIYLIYFPFLFKYDLFPP